MINMIQEISMDEQDKQEIKQLLENTVCASRGNDAEGSYEYGEKVANRIIQLIESKYEKSTNVS